MARKRMIGSYRVCVFQRNINVSVCALGLNPYLTLNTANSGTILIDLTTDDKEFQSVEEEVRWLT